VITNHLLISDQPCGSRYLKLGDLVGLNKDNYLILDTLLYEYDSHVKAMEVDEKLIEEYLDIGGLDK
jgi:ATP-dependent 26S proteasome regulatory subunit